MPTSRHSAAADKAAAAGVAVVAAAAVRQTAPQLSDVLEAALSAPPELQSQPSQWQSSPLRATSMPFSPTGRSGQSGRPAAAQPASPIPVTSSLAVPVHPGGYGLPASPFGTDLPGANVASQLDTLVPRALPFSPSSPRNAGALHAHCQHRVFSHHSRVCCAAKPSTLCLPYAVVPSSNAVYFFITQRLRTCICLTPCWLWLSETCR